MTKPRKNWAHQPDDFLRLTLEHQSITLTLLFPVHDASRIGGEDFDDWCNELTRILEASGFTVISVEVVDDNFVAVVSRVVEAHEERRSFQSIVSRGIEQADRRYCEFLSKRS